MRQDKIASLKQRLHRGADAFEFQALIDGVSTLEEQGVKGRTRDGVKDSSVPEPIDSPSPVPTEAGNTLETDVIPAPSDTRSPHHPITPSPTREERLRTALDALGDQLAQEVGRMRAAILANEIEDAGFCLAHVNRILELLHSIDPAGDLARQLGTTAAPPDGRAWPATAWSVVEFAESPFSALLPSSADESFLRNLLYASWGVAFETVDG